MMDLGRAETLRINVFDETNLANADIHIVIEELCSIFRHSQIDIGSVPGIADVVVYWIAKPPRGHEEEALCRTRRDIALKIFRTPPSA